MFSEKAEKEKKQAVERIESAKKQIQQLSRAREDAEQLSAREYVVDLYDIDRPISLDMVFVKGGIGVDGAAELKYDEEQDGWYMGERLDSADEVLDALAEAGAIERGRSG